MAWERKYTDDQRAAIERCYVDLRWKARRIREEAAAGRLQVVHDGPFLDPFNVPTATIYDYGRRAEKRKAGDLRPELLSKTPADRADSLQRRLVGLVDHELARLEKVQARHPNTELDGEHARKLARAIREIQAFGDPTSKRLPKTPGAQENGRQTEGPTRDDLSGALLAAANRHTPQPANGAPLPVGEQGSVDERINAATPTSINGNAPPHDDTHNGHDDGDDGPSLGVIEAPTGLVAAAVVVGQGST